MNRTRAIAWLLLIALPAVSFADELPQEETAPTTLAEVNAALKRRKAKIELKDGRTVEKTRKVLVGEELTTWNAEGRKHQMETAEIIRITTLRKRRPILKGMALGLVVGAGLVILDVSDEDDSLTTAALVPAAILIGAGIGAVSGGIVGVARGKKASQVVFEAPLSDYLETRDDGENGSPTGTPEDS